MLKNELKCLLSEVMAQYPYKFMFRTYKDSLRLYFRGVNDVDKVYNVLKAKGVIYEMLFVNGVYRVIIIINKKQFSC